MAIGHSLETEKSAGGKLNMERDIKLNISLFFLVLLLSVFFVSAVTTINTPAASTTISGSTTFNVTITELMGANLVNLTFYLSSPSTANSSWSTIGTNNSLNLTLLSNRTITTIDISSMIEDSNDYTLNVTTRNATSGTVISEDTNTVMTVDQTVPQAATSLYETGTIRNQTFTLGGTVVGRNTTSCTLLFDGTNPGSSSYTMTHSGNTCTRALSLIPEQTYRYYIRTSDESNTTDSSRVTVTVDVKSSASKIPALLQEPGVKSAGGSALTVTENFQGIFKGNVGGIPTILIVVVVVIVIALILINRKR